MLTVVIVNTMVTVVIVNTMLTVVIVNTMVTVVIVNTMLTVVMASQNHCTTTHVLTIMVTFTYDMGYAQQTAVIYRG